jgi:hypothetical protein
MVIFLDLPVDLPFEMPDYRTMDILDINFKVTSRPPLPFLEDAVPISLDDSDMYTRDCLYEVELDQPRIFPHPSIQATTKVGTNKTSLSMGLHQSIASNRLGKLAVRQPSLQATSRASSGHTAGAGIQERVQVRPYHPSLKTSQLRANSATRAGERPKATRPSIHIASLDYPEVIHFDIGTIDLLL